MIILDTNIISEVVKPQPAANVARWMSAQPVEILFTTAVTQAEILYGLAIMPTGRRRTMLEAAFEQMFSTVFIDRILSFDSDAARSFAAIVSSRRQTGRPISHIDAQIAAIAHSRGAIVATRNVADFEGCEVDLVNPWTN